MFDNQFFGIKLEQPGPLANKLLIISINNFLSISIHKLSVKTFIAYGLYISIGKIFQFALEYVSVAILITIGSVHGNSV